MANYLVTGAAGFIGSHLVEELLNRDHYVRGFDNISTGDKSNISSFLEVDSFDFVEGDLRNEDEVMSAVSGIDYVLHQGAVPSVPRSIDNPKLTTEVNCTGTTNLLIAARNEGVKKVVSASSSSVYGPSDELPKSEDMALNPVSPYALSKHWTEQLTLQFSEHYDIETVALRYFNIFGPRQDPNSEYSAVIPKFIRLMLDGDRPIIYGDGEQSRDFTFVENVVEANIKAANSDCSGEALNIACNDRVTVNELVDSLNNLLECDTEPIYDNPRPGDVRHSKAAIEKARKEIGYEPRVGFLEGLRRTVDYYRK